MIEVGFTAIEYTQTPEYGENRPEMLHEDPILAVIVARNSNDSHMGKLVQITITGQEIQPMSGVYTSLIEVSNSIVLINNACEDPRI